MPSPPSTPDTPDSDPPKKSGKSGSVTSGKGSAEETNDSKAAKIPARNEVVGAGEFRSSADTHDGLVSGIVGFNVKKLRVADVNGSAIFEGDIYLGPIERFKRTGTAADSINLRTNLSASGRANDPRANQNGVVITGQRFRWPNGLIPYEIADPSIEATVQQAIQHWEQNTSIRFTLRTPFNAINHPNYVSFEVRDGCFSAVGMQGGPQVISIGLGCALGQAIHEIGHTVGLWHEQSREDRDQFVHIAWENILPGMEHNFDQHITDGDDVGPYDYDSIMHYPARAFSSNNRDTIVTLGGQQIGQRNGLSPADIATVLQLYPGASGNARHLYTSLILELAQAIGTQGFKSDGVVFYGWPFSLPGTLPLLKLSGPQGKQLYTTSVPEAFDAISKDQFNFDSVACYVFSTPIAGLTPLLRLDDSAQRDSLLTTSVVEAQQAAAHGYEGHGVEGHVLTTYFPGTIPVYSLSKPG